MNFVKMASHARHNRFPSFLPVQRMTEKEKAGILYVGITAALGDLAKAYRGSQAEKLDAYCAVLRYFLEIGSDRQWLYKMLLSDEELQAMQEKWQAPSINTVFLILEQQLLNCYFKHQEAAFLHAWHILIKFGLVELGFSPAAIEERFKELYPL